MIDELKAVLDNYDSHLKPYKFKNCIHSFRYFNPKTAVQIQFTNLKEKTSDILSFYIMQILIKHKISHNMIALSWDNCSIIFRSAATKKKNVFTIL